MSMDVSPFPAITREFESCGKCLGFLTEIYESTSQFQQGPLLDTDTM